MICHDQMLEVLDDLNTKLEVLLAETVAVEARSTSMDYRGVGGMLWVGTDFIAFEAKYLKSANYYWGLEYVDDSYRTIIGDYVFYYAEDERIKEIIQSID